MGVERRRPERFLLLTQCCLGLNAGQFNCNDNLDNIQATFYAMRLRSQSIHILLSHFPNGSRFKFYVRTLPRILLAIPISSTIFP